MDWLDSFFQNIQVSIHQPVFTVSVFFVAGVLSSLFPCYYPLIPITIGFLQKRKAKYVWTHPFVYWLGSLFIYLSLGILSATTGLILSKILQNGWVVLGMGLLFLYLSYAIIDFVQLEPRFFRKFEEKTKSYNSLFFTFLMGIFSGLAASACVSPALVSVLLFVVQTSSQLEKDLTSLLFGILTTTSYGAGLGLPFFLSGILGAKLPKSGSWMELTKKFFFVVIFLLALYQIQKGLLVFKIEETFTYLLLLIITIGSALLYLFMKNIIKDIFQLRKLYVYTSLIFIGVFLFFSVQIYGEKIKSTPHASIETLYQQNYGKYEYKKNLTIYRSLQEALNEAQKQDKLIFIDFYADWCTNCVEFAKMMEDDENLNTLLQKAIVLKIYDTDPIFEYFAQQKGYEELQIGLPFFAIIDKNQKLVYKTTYYKDIGNFKKVIENYEQRKNP
ncbi:MAG: thioredoxin family protein [Leptospiraceae bacterium]|nr:thioredoxin family protein [Leptospiraceae bacterium]MDW7976410.1 cytochrome c biogenesis protein CcdA [Leptospiraceae bacterium]